MARSNRFDGQLRCLHKVRLYPTCAQQAILFGFLRLTRELYNALLEQRRDRWSRERGRVTDQYRQITDLRAAEPSRTRNGAVGAWKSTELRSGQVARCGLTTLTTNADARTM